MDTIKFVIEDYIDQENGFQFPTVNIYINEKNLIQLIEQIERNYRVPLKLDERAGQSYVGLHPGYHRDFRDEFLGLVRRPYSVLLTCTCLEELCNSIVGRIVVASKTVTWSELRSPFLGTEANSWEQSDGEIRADGYPIDYSGLGRFVFERDQYMDALNRL